MFSPQSSCPCVGAPVGLGCEWGSGAVKQRCCYEMLLPGRRVQPSIPCFPRRFCVFKLVLVLGKKSDAPVPMPVNKRRAVATGGCFKDYRVF